MGMCKVYSIISFFFYQSWGGLVYAIMRASASNVLDPSLRISVTANIPQTLVKGGVVVKAKCHITVSASNVTAIV